jgi:4-alpha-glucanotransferase
VEEERAADRSAQEAVLAMVRSRVPAAPGHDGGGTGGQDGAGQDGTGGGMAEQDTVAQGNAEQDTVEALHAFIAQTPSVLLGVALTDAVGERRTQNQPGTADEYPNWRIPLAGPDGEAILIEDLPGNERFQSLMRALTSS